MKKPIFLILIGIGVLLLVGGAVFVVPWFGKIYLTRWRRWLKNMPNIGAH